MRWPSKRLGTFWRPATTRTTIYFYFFRRIVFPGKEAKYGLLGGDCFFAAVGPCRVMSLKKKKKSTKKTSRFRKNHRRGHRTRARARINITPQTYGTEEVEHQLAIDSATEILCIAKTSVDYIIMKSFCAKLDWVTERLSFQYGNVTMPTIHARRSLKSQYCSVTKHTGDEQRLPILVAKKYVTPAAHEALQRVSSTARPQKDTLALIEPRITPGAHEALSEFPVRHDLKTIR